MPVPDLILQKPLVLISPGASVLGGSSAGTALNFGAVVLIYSTGNSFEVDDNVMYNTVGQILLDYNGDEYALINEDKIYYKEVTPP